MAHKIYKISLFNKYTLRLIHSIHGEIAFQDFYMGIKFDSAQVRAKLKRWRYMYGKSFLQCETLWDD